MYIAVASGKGGTGKTLVSTALALCAGACTYVDLDVEEPNGFIFLEPDIQKEFPYTRPAPDIDEAVCSFCGKCARACAYNALAVIPPLRKVMVFRELCHSCGVCAYVCPVKGALSEVEKDIGTIRTGRSGDIVCIEGRLHVGQPSGVPLISGIIREHLNTGGLVIVDSPPGTSCPVVESIKESDYVILVTEPTPFGLNDLKLAVELVKDLGKTAGIILNKDGARGDIIEDYSKKVNIPIMLRIPYSIQIQKAYSRGMPLTVAAPELKEVLTRLIRTVADGSWK